MDCSILVVDETPQVLTALSAVGKNEGCSVTHAHNSKAALRALGTKPFHLIFADLKLSHLNGSNLLRRARSLNPGMMIVLMTGTYDTTLSMNSFLFEADDYLFRPCGREEVAMRLRSCLRRLEQERKSSESNDRIGALNEQVLNMLMIMSHDLRSPLISMSATLQGW